MTGINIRGLIICPYQYCELAAQAAGLEEHSESTQQRKLWVDPKTETIVQHVGSTDALLRRPQGMVLYLTKYAQLTAPLSTIRNHVDGLEMRVIERMA